MGFFNKLFNKKNKKVELDEKWIKLLSTLPKNGFAVVNDVFNYGDCAAVLVKILRDEIRVGEEIKLNDTKVVKILEIRNSKKVSLESATVGDSVILLLAIQYEMVKEGDLLSKIVTNGMDFNNLVE